MASAHRIHVNAGIRIRLQQQAIDGSQIAAATAPTRLAKRDLLLLLLYPRLRAAAHGSLLLLLSLLSLLSLLLRHIVSCVFACGGWSEMENDDN
jgi:hypothetical protein